MRQTLVQSNGPLRIGSAFAGLLLAVCLHAITACAAEAAASAPPSGPVPDIFESDDIPRIQIQITPKDVERLRTRGWNWARAGANRERPEVQATIIESGRVYTNVALHLKGAAGSFQPIESKPSFTLNFDKFVKGQKFRGLEKISLNNSVQDPSYLTEKLCRELFLAAGIPAPRADYALVELNGRKLGLYVLLEGYNRQFLKRHFKNSQGTLYEGGFLKDIAPPLSVNVGDKTQDQSVLRRLLAIADEPDLPTRFERLEKLLDMDRFVTYIAMEVMVCHWDGYSMNKNNYRVYHDSVADKIIFMPHGMDQMFGVLLAQPNLAVRPAMQGLISRAVLETSEGRRRYFERLRSLNQELFDLEKLTNHAFQITARLAPALAELTPTAVTNHQQQVEELIARMTERKHSLEEQLSGAKGKYIEFDDEGVAPLSGWTSLTNAGTPLVSMAPGVNGKPVLHLGAVRGTSVASFRTKVLLEEGRYSFEGRMQTREISADPRDRRAGSGLRVSGMPSMKKKLGTSDWAEVAFEFDVPDGLHDIELVCELRASKGEVWFDAESLKLVRK